MSLLLDNPFVLSQAFYPRAANPEDGFRSTAPGVYSGTIPVEKDVVLGYRLYAHVLDAPVMVFFHGNGEIAPDYDYIAPYYHNRTNASLLVIDFRGYGWSTGKPTFHALLADCTPIYAALPGILTQANLANSPRFIMGRSMGSVPAIHLAHQHPEGFKGLVIESGFARVFDLARLWGFMVPANLPDPLGNLGKVKSLPIPLLIIHGNEDELIPVSHGQAFYDASPSAQKTILRVPGAGHNNLLAVAPQAYFEALAKFIEGQ